MFRNLVEIFDIPTGTTKTIYASHFLALRPFNIIGGGTLRIMTGTPSDTNNNLPNIFIYNSGNYAQFQNQIVLAVGVPDLLKDKLNPVDHKVITAFCNNNTYISRAKNFEATKADDLAASEASKAAEILETKLEIFPNPADAQTTLRYQISQAGEAKILISNTLGVVVQEILHTEKHETGSFEVSLNTQNLSSGMYICTLQTAEGIKTNKLLISK